ncbi:hypothetical protein NC651_028845 [Populus alba x Populus x berolinensis]|nr:hypothetical protein NC651_028845 [Populus alba x Populus x berolinensis]
MFFAFLVTYEIECAQCHGWCFLSFLKCQVYLVTRQSRSGIYLLHRRHPFGMNPFVFIPFVEPKNAFDEGKCSKVTQLITDSSVQVPAARTKAGVKSRPSSAFFLQANHK